MKKMKKVLLYSGGMDSWLVDKIWKPDLKLYINMNTRYSMEEIKKIKELDNDVIFIDFPLGQWEDNNSVLPLRNLYLVMIACNITGLEDIIICSGATEGDRVLDESIDFMDKAEDILNYLYQPQFWVPKGKKIIINKEFKKYTKTDLLKLYIDQGGNVEEAFNRSFSCYSPINNKECWQCRACFRKFISFALNKMTFSQDIIDKNISYIKRKILPEITSGTYGSIQEEIEIKKILKLYTGVDYVL